MRKLKKYLVKTKVFWKIEWFFKSDSTPLCIVRLYGGIDSICLAFTMAISFPSEMVSTISLPIQKLVDFSFSNCVKKEISPRCNYLWKAGTIPPIFDFLILSWRQWHLSRVKNPATQKIFIRFSIKIKL